MMGRVTKNRTLIALYCTSVRTYDRAGTPSSKAASHVFSDGVCRCHWQESNKESQLQNGTELFQVRSCSKVVPSYTRKRNNLPRRELIVRLIVLVS